MLRGSWLIFFNGVWYTPKILEVKDKEHRAYRSHLEAINNNPNLLENRDRVSKTGIKLF